MGFQCRSEESGQSVFNGSPGQSFSIPKNDIFAVRGRKKQQDAPESTSRRCTKQKEFEISLALCPQMGRQITGSASTTSAVGTTFNKTQWIEEEREGFLLPAGSAAADHTKVSILEDSGFGLGSCDYGAMFGKLSPL